MVTSELLFRKIIAQFKDNYPKISRIDENKSALVRSAEFPVSDMLALIHEQLIFLKDAELFLAHALRIYESIRFHSNRSKVFHEILNEIYIQMPTMIDILNKETSSLVENDVQNFRKYYDDEKKILVSIESKLEPYLYISNDAKLKSSIKAYIGRGLAILALIIALGGSVGAQFQIKPGEHGVPSNVMLAYARTVDTTSFHLEAPVGTYIGKVFLDTEEEIIKFQQKLKDLGYSEEQIASFTDLFTSKGIIVYNNDAKNFESVMNHERMHKIIEDLQNDKREIMKSAAKGLIDYYYEIDKINDIEKPGNSGFVAIAVAMNWEEMYPYMYGGQLIPQVENDLMQKYPIAHNIYIQLCVQLK